MSIYNIYTCTVCRRSKSILQDHIYAVPNSCTITKGCGGKLLLVGESSVQTTTPAVPNTTDWYPRGTNVNVNSTQSVVAPVLLSTSATGVVSIAVKSATQPPASLTLSFSQRRVDDIPYTQYVYMLYTETQLLSGKDGTGKILRFNQAAIDENRVIVRVNGILQVVAVDMTLEPDKINFIGKPKADGSLYYPVGNVEVAVYAATDTILRQLTFTQNATSLSSIATGSWGNVKWVEDAGQWWIYSCNGVGGLPPAARLKVTSLTDSNNTEYPDARFVLASDPYDTVDRYLQYGINLSALKNDFSINVVLGTITQLYADYSCFAELFPPMVLVTDQTLSLSSFLIADTFSTSTVAQDVTSTKLTGTKVLGPI